MTGSRNSMEEPTKAPIQSAAPNYWFLMLGSSAPHRLASHIAHKTGSAFIELHRPVKIYLPEMKKIVGQIEEALRTAAIEIHENIIYQIKHSDPEKKAELKALLAQGISEKSHTVVEVDFVKKAKRASRRERRGKKYRSAADGIAEDHLKIAEESPSKNDRAGSDTDDPIITIYNSPIYIYGQYIKLSRNMTQTPLTICGELKTPRSVSDFTREFERFYDSGPAKFMASGREDVDVRCTGGRPFVLEVPSPKKNLHATAMRISLHSDIDIRDCCIVSRAYKERINTDESSKLYFLVIYSEERIVFERQYDLVQKTPLRVLHRRANLARSKSIELLDSVEHREKDGFYYEVNIKASSGAYIKEWVSGDFGRTVPNLGADLLSLDVVGIDKPFHGDLVVSEMILSKTFIDQD